MANQGISYHRLASNCFSGPQRRDIPMMFGVADVVGSEDGSEIRSEMVTIEVRPGAIPWCGAKGNEVRARAAAAQ